VVLGRHERNFYGRSFGRCSAEALLGQRPYLVMPQMAELIDLALQRLDLVLQGEVGGS
jgi:hypothetical protein